MYNWIGRLIFLLLVFCFFDKAYSQQDVDFHLNAHLLPGKNILKVKRDYNDPYVWVLAQNNEVYRVNSLTLAIDDYTAKFSAYSNLQFIDIAGLTADTVFVASNSTSLIVYKNGNLTTVGIADGLADNINSIGLANYSASYAAQWLLIGTASGMGNYDTRSGALTYYKNHNKTYVPNKIFSTTYRSEMVGRDDYDPYNPYYYPVFFKTLYTTYGYNIRHTVESGNEINTAYYVPVGIMSGTVYGGSFFWGNENGMYQESLNWDNDDPNDFASFLTGIKVNKITDLFGLASFYAAYNPTISKDNLLIGTDNGLYFSNSLLAKSTGRGIALFSLFHFDLLGNIPINDICVNFTGVLRPGVAFPCENAIWLGTTDGLYLLNPDYGKYFDPSIKANALYIDNLLTDTVTTVNLCGGDTLKPQINRQFINSNTIQWMKDGKDIIGENKPQLNITTAGEYSAVLYSSCENIHIETNRIKVNIISGPVFSFNYPNKIQQCNNTPDTLKTDNNAGYRYRWYSNGVLNGDTTSSFIATETGKYKVEVSACTNSWVPSKEVEVDMVTLPTPQITADKVIYCAEDTASLSVNVPVDNSYTISWYRDGNLLTNNQNLTTIKDTKPGAYTVVLNSAIANCSQIAGPYQLKFIAAPVFTSQFPAEIRSCTDVPLNVSFSVQAAYHYRWYTNGVLNGDKTTGYTATQTGKYKVEASACAGSWVSSTEIQIDIVTLPVPAISADKPAFCIGDNAILSAGVPADAGYTINWYRDNVLLNGSNQPVLTTNIAGNYTVTVVNNVANSDGTFCSQSSAARILAFDSPPSVSIQKVVKTTLCDGQTISLLAHYVDGTITWSTGETTDQINVNRAGNYSVTVTSASGCQATGNIEVSFLPAPVFSVKDTTICTYKHQVITLIAPQGYSAYAWNGVPGNQTYQVNQPQTIALTVTDANGCQATQPIKVVEHCPEIWIPNAFTPNGDGINDVWVIEGLDGDPTVLVSVFTRYGGLVFQSKGFGTPWNGERNGEKLPAGTYYYLLNAKSGTQKFSGALTIVY